MPFPGPLPPRLPSILTPGQFARKYFASSQEVIWEQRVRPSQLNDLTGEAAGAALGELTTGLEYGMRWPDGAGALARLSLAWRSRFSFSAAFNCSSVGCFPGGPDGHGTLW